MVLVRHCTNDSGKKITTVCCEVEDISQSHLEEGLAIMKDRKQD